MWNMTKYMLAAAIAASLWLPSPLCTAEGDVIKLPPVAQSGGQPLMEALWNRRSNRDFTSQSVTPQQLSEIVWAALGVNRPEDGHKRTSPTARNRQDVELYVLNADGAFYYDALKHELKTLAEGDQTALLGAPLGLVFIAPADNAARGLNVGYCSQNVYLYAASAGLNTVAKTSADRPALSELLQLPEGWELVLVQLVGPRP